MIKYVEVLIQVRYLVRSEKIFQYFIVSDSKYSKYVLDNRYELYNKFNKKFRDLALQDNVEFLEKREEKDRISLEYSISGSFLRPKSLFFTIAGFVPTTTSCEYCKFLEEDENFCIKKNKKLQKKLKTCSVFNQKEGLFKT